LRDLRRLAINPLPMEPEDWQGRIHSRLAALPDAAEPLQRAQLLAAFSVGTEIIHLRRIMPELGLAQELESTLQSLARGNSVAATAQLAALDHRLASIVNFSAQGSLAMRARGRILVVSDALADHREYFEGESA
jgi:hypothetical protein